MQTTSFRRIVTFLVSLALMSIPAMIAVLTVAGTGCGKMCSSG
jgi:hypothetical protein